ncbi:MAG: Fic family protein [bacterium]
MKPRYPTLYRYKIPYEVVHSDALVNWLMRIAESRPFLDEYLGTPLEVKLLRKAKVRAITYSNQIEGNALGESEVTAILKGQRVVGLVKDIKEVQNYHAALDYVDELATGKRPIKIADLCDIQRLVTQGLIPEKQCGRVRTVNVSIVSSASGEKIDDCPEPHCLKDLLDDLWKWLEDTKGMNPFVRAFSFHVIAVSIHPFADGNGRTMRLMQHLLLLQSGQRIARFVPSETAIMQGRDRYYSVIRQSRLLGRLDPVLEFLAECFAVSADAVVEEGRKILRDSSGKSPQARHRKILANAAKREQFSMRDVLGWLPNIPRRTLERDLAALVRKRALKAKGELKARTYRLATS